MPTDDFGLQETVALPPPIAGPTFPSTPGLEETVVLSVPLLPPRAHATGAVDAVRVRAALREGASGGAPASPRRRAPLLSRRQWQVATAGLAAVAAVLIAILLLPAPSPSPSDLAQRLVLAIAARDGAGAAGMMASPARLAVLARDLGVDALPASVTMSAQGLTVRARGGASVQNADVSAFWTLDVAGARGYAASVAQAASLSFARDAAGRWQLSSWQVHDPLTFDLGAYFGSSGTSAADRDAVVDDLQDGVAWLGGAVRVSASQHVDAVNSEPVITPDADRLTSYRQTVKQAVPGELTHWGVVVSGGSGQGSYDIAASKTKQEQPAQIAVGTLTSDGAVTDAKAWIAGWAARVGKGDAAAEEAVLSPSVVTASAWSRIAVDGVDIPSDAVAMLASADPVTVSDGPITVVRESGSWRVDTAASDLMRDWLPAQGTPLQVQRNAALIDFSGCAGTTTGANDTIVLEGIALYGHRKPPVAVLSVDATGDLRCSGVAIDAMSVAWRGHADAVTTQYTPVFSDHPLSVPDGEAHAVLRAELPAAIDASAVPVRIAVTVGTVEWFGTTQTKGGTETFTAGG